MTHSDSFDFGVWITRILARWRIHTLNALVAGVDHGGAHVLDGAMVPSDRGTSAA